MTGSAKRELENATKFLERQGWVVVRDSNHRVMRCGCGGGHSTSLSHTPKQAGSIIRNAKKALNNCRKVR